MHIARSPAASFLARSVPLLLAAAWVLPGAALAQYPTPRPAPPQLAAALDVTAATVQLLDVLPGAAGQFAVPVVLGGQPRTMVLQPHDLRGPGFQLLVQDATGIHVEPTPPCTTYRGSLLEDPTVQVAASIVDGSVQALVRLPGTGGAPGEQWVVQPVRDVEPSAGPSVHAVFRATDSVPLPYHCGTTHGAYVPPRPDGVGIDTTYLCELAVEADIQFYQLNGSSVTATQNDITAVMNQVEFIYDRDCDIQYTLTTVMVTTTAVYTSSDPNTLLNQFASRWSTVHAGIPRDLAHLFTGRNIGQASGGTIGIAAMSSVCNLGIAYGLSQSRFTANFNGRVGLTSHEVGHGWSAQHCDGINPCYIMCSGLGGCSGNVTLFGPSEINQITSFAASRSCLSVVAQTPAITAATPNNVTVFAPGTVVLTGSGFTGAISYRVGTTTYGSGFSVTNDSSMSIVMPQGTAVGLTSVAVTNSLGTSNSFPILYTVTTPPKLKPTPAIPPTGGIASFDFAGTPGRLWFLVLGITNTTQPYQGFPLLEPHLLLTAGAFSAPLGIDNVSIPVPGGMGLLIFYLQVLEATAVNPAATGTTNVVTTILL